MMAMLVAAALALHATTQLWAECQGQTRIVFEHAS